MFLVDWSGFERASCSVELLWLLRGVSLLCLQILDFPSDLIVGLTRHTCFRNRCSSARGLSLGRSWLVVLVVIEDLAGKDRDRNRHSDLVMAALSWRIRNLWGIFGGNGYALV